jgi:hypothetical protein
MEIVNFFNVCLNCKKSCLKVRFTLSEEFELRIETCLCGQRWLQFFCDFDVDGRSRDNTIAKQWF